MQRLNMTIWRVVALLITGGLLVAACGGGGDEVDVNLFGQQPTQLDSQSAQQVASTFLDAWRQKDYETMYALISPNARDAFSQSVFVSTYEDVDTGLLNIDALEWTIHGVISQGTTAVVDYSVTFDTRLLGTFTDPRSGDDPRLMRLIATPEGWRVAWSRGDIFSGWTNSSSLVPERTLPTRGNIYDREGRILVDQNGVSMQLYARKDEMSSEAGCIEVMSRVLRQDVVELQERYGIWNPDSIFLLGEVSQDTWAVEGSAIQAECSTDPRERSTRQYYDRVAPHLVGYVGQIPLERQSEYEARGYPSDALVGRGGVEEAFENELSGTIGIRLVIRSVTGTLIRVVAERPASPGQSVYLTIDRDLQLGLQFLLADAYSQGQPTWAPTSPGAAAVVMDINTGEILAMASYPDYDPSVFNPDTPVYQPSEVIAGYRNDPNRPLLNRATQGSYPLGSVFKIFSMAAGLDSGAWSLSSSVNCTGQWNGEPYGDRVRSDWLPEGHGTLNMQQGLIASCNPYFWSLGLALNQADPDILPSYTRAFGFGSAPSLQGLNTDSGFVLGPDNIVEERSTQWTNSNALNLVIGQDVVGVNPLQVVRATAAIANGGTLYRPLVVQKVQLIGEEPSQTFAPRGDEMDIDPDVLAAIREAMCEVTTNHTIGTAAFIFDAQGDSWLDYHDNAVSVCGKTGTAQSGQANPHAWFSAFAPADNPQIAVVVIVENSCEGSEVAAPIVRRTLEVYFGLDQNYGWPSLWQSGCTQIGPDVIGP